MIKIKITPKEKMKTYIDVKEKRLPNKDKLYEVLFNVSEEALPYTKNMYKKAKRYGPSFLEPFVNFFVSSNPKYYGKNFDVSKLLGSYEINHFLSNATTSKERKYILDQIKNKKIDLEKLSLFVYSLKHLATSYYKENIKIMNIKNLFINVKFGLLNKHMVNRPYYLNCYSTYQGFINSFNESKIFTTKAKIDGKIRRVFIKNPIHNAELGYAPLFIDPKTFNIYAFLTDNKGKIRNFYLRVDAKKIPSHRKKDIKQAMEKYVKRTIENQKKYRQHIKKKKPLVRVKRK